MKPLFCTWATRKMVIALLEIGKSGGKAVLGCGVVGSEEMKLAGHIAWPCLECEDCLWLP